jgi:amidase
MNNAPEKVYELDDSRYITAFSKDAEPVLSVSDGAVVRVRTIDCYMNNLREENDPRGAAKGAVNSCNPATGPIYIEGARKGDTLKCEILSIEVDDYASMRIRPGAGFMGDKVTKKLVRAVPIKDGFATLAGVRIPIEPMIGVIGAAPAGEAIDTETPHRHGGNMDNRMIRAGSTLYLPVHADGALFAVGDVHAQMGDGEVGLCGLECPAYVTVRLSVIRGRQESVPVVEYNGSFQTVASAETLDLAAKEASDAMLDFLVKRTGIDQNDLVMLMGQICDLAVCQVVDPLLTVRMTLRAGILDVAF